MQIIIEFNFEGGVTITAAAFRNVIAAAVRSGDISVDEANALITAAGDEVQRLMDEAIATAKQMN